MGARMGTGVGANRVLKREYVQMCPQTTDGVRTGVSGIRRSPHLCDGSLYLVERNGMSLSNAWPHNSHSPTLPIHLLLLLSFRSTLPPYPYPYLHRGAAAAS